MSKPRVYLKSNLMDASQLKLIVKDKYSEIANSHSTKKGNSCCGASCCCSTTDYAVFNESYDKSEGYIPEADLGLGCGIPTEFAAIRKGDTVIDLGSGAGNDCFVARSLTGEEGRVIGVDMTEAMIEKARLNAGKLGFNNVEFILGDIEDLPVENAVADVVISNCVLNLVPDKELAFREIYRVMKHGGHLSVSDVVLRGELPGNIRKAAEMYAGCVSGAVAYDKYLDIIVNAGFINIKVNKEKLIDIPDSILLNYLSNEELRSYRTSGAGVYSVNVYAEKPV